jgi:thiol:disulfide interchange protein
MKILTWMMAALLGLVIQARADEGTQWLTSQPAALEQAKTQNKLVLMNFTGSDWCPYCKLLDKEVFATTEFKAYAATNLVLMEVDFPNHKEQPAELRRANTALVDRYGIEGFPTVLVLSGDGKTVGKLGYEPGGPKNFIKHLEELKRG